MAKSDHQKSVYFKNANLWEVLEKLSVIEDRSVNSILERMVSDQPKVKKLLPKKS